MQPRTLREVAGLGTAPARGAFNLGDHARIVANATATRDLPAAGGGIVPSEQVQAASLAAAGDIFAVIVPGLEEIG